MPDSLPIHRESMAAADHDNSTGSEDTAATETGRGAAPQHLLDEREFIRSRLFESDKSAFGRYSELVFRDFTWWKLIRYELLVTLVGPLAGAVGLVLRKRFYPALFLKAGRGGIFGRNLTLHHADRITLGDNVVLDRDCVLDARGAGDDGIRIGNRVIINRGAAIQAKIGRIEIGDDCNIGAHVDLVSQGPIVIGNNVSIAGKAIVAGGRYVVQEDDAERGSKRRFSGGTIRIGDNTRIGMSAIIQDGVTIGENAIVAPGSVVYDDVPADTVVWGSPARPVRSRTATPRPATAAQKSGPENDPALEARVCQYLENDLFIEFGPDGIGTGDSLIDANLMDSLGLVRLLLWIEQEFDIDLDFSELDPADIDSVDKIVARIGERRQ